jgi:predicted RNA-binding protein with PIN domain
MAAEQESAELGTDFTELPTALRAKLAEVAADAVGELPAAQLPAAVRAVARFAPAKRARNGATPLLAALGTDPSFRGQVREWLRSNRPAVLEFSATDALAAAAAALLTDNPAAPMLVELLTARGQESTARAERDAALARGHRLASELAGLRAKLDGVDPALLARASAAVEEADRLRRRLRDQGTKLRAARDEADAASAALAQVRAESEQEIKRAEAERDAERARAKADRSKARRAEEATQVARQAAREAREADETRLALLVDTIDGALTGLRGELSLGNCGVRPADTVRGASIAEGASARVRDPGELDALLRMPAAHLIVDGYNVTKTGYPELSLADQRDRLARQLAGVVARNGTEVTVVFDGAGVIAHNVWPRGVRVLFSEPGVIADDVIRSLVAAEPVGRPLIVASTDREVADSTRRKGAHSVSSAILLARLLRV